MTPTRAETERGTVTDLLFRHYPPSIRNALLEDEQFISRFDLPIVKWARIIETNASFIQSELHQMAILLFNDPNSSQLIDDRNSTQWTASVDMEDSGAIILQADGHIAIPLSNLWMLMPKQSDRIAKLKSITSVCGLSSTKFTEWHAILSKRPANDDEVDILLQDMSETIAAVENKIEGEFGKKQFFVHDFVPLNTDYYKNLIGEIAPGITATEFLQSEYKIFVDKDTHLPPTRRIFNALLSCWHSLSAKAISKIECDFDELVELIEHTATTGSTHAIAGLAEVCLFKLETEPRLSEAIGRLIDCLLPHDRDECSLKLLSSICMGVDAELADSRAFQFAPPFCRRLAAFSHACLIERVFRKVISGRPDFPKQCENLSQAFMERDALRFYTQNLCDMRREPHWFPEHISPQSLKCEFLSRILNTANQVKEFIVDEKLKSKLLEDVEGGLRKQLAFIGASVPGPLEGAGDNNALSEIEQSAIEQLEKDPINANSFNATVNIAIGFRPSIELAELAATKLENVQYHLKNFEADDKFRSFIYGFALLAAKTRSHKTALALKEVVSRRFNFRSKNIEMHDFVWVGVITAAAFEDIGEWSEFLETWCAPIAFGQLSKSDAETIQHFLKMIIKYVPAATAKLAPSLTALDAFQKSLAQDGNI